MVMQEHMETQTKLFRMRQIMLVLLVLVVILAVSNLGTSFAAASLVRDTDTSSNTELTDKHTHEVLSTKKSAESFEFERTTIAPDGRPRLCAVDGNVECEINTFRTMILARACVIKLSTTVPEERLSI
jgi:cell division protein FtsL